MGSLPHLSILKGPTRVLKPNYIHRIFENIAEMEPINNNIALLCEGKQNISIFFTGFSHKHDHLIMIRLNGIENDKERLKKNNLMVRCLIYFLITIP